MQQHLFPPIMPLLSFPTHTPSPVCAPFSFIHILLLQQQRTVISKELALFLIIIFLPASICIPLALPSLGISLLSFPPSPYSPSLFLLVPSCLFFFLSFAHVRLIALPLLLPNSFSPVSLYFSFSLSCFFLFSPAKSCNEV